MTNEATLDFFLDDLMSLGVEEVRFQVTILGDASAETTLERVDQIILDRKVKIAALTGGQ
jgi:hypothetical protein